MLPITPEFFFFNTGKSLIASGGIFKCTQLNYSPCDAHVCRAVLTVQPDRKLGLIMFIESAQALLDLPNICRYLYVFCEPIVIVLQLTSDVDPEPHSERLFHYGRHPPCGSGSRRQKTVKMKNIWMPSVKIKVPVTVPK